MSMTEYEYILNSSCQKCLKGAATDLYDSSAKTKCLHCDFVFKTLTDMHRKYCFSFKRSQGKKQTR